MDHREKKEITTVSIAQSEWERLKKVEASYKLTRQYSDLLEVVNRKLDDRVLELELLNDIAKGFATVAFDQKNIAGFLLGLLKKKLHVGVLTLFLWEDAGDSEAKAILVLASERPLESKLRENIRGRVLNGLSLKTSKPIDPQRVSIVDMTGEMTGSESADALSHPLKGFYSLPLIVSDKPVGMMSMFLPEETALAPDDENFVKILATQVALFIENDRIKEVITNERNKLEVLSQDLARSNEGLKELDRLKSEFVSTVSHELRTPLTSIRGSLGLIAAGMVGEVSDQGKTLLTIAVNNCERLVRLINNILDTEKIESGKMEFAMKPVILESLLEQAVDANRAFGDQFKVQLILEKGLPDAKVLGDADRLTQVVTNLLSNAVKFSPKGEEVRVATKLDEGWLRVSISDRGPGIPEEFKNRIFQKFSQAHSTDNGPKKVGTGLGLSISKGIVEQIGGRIGFQTGPDGTTFYFELPEWKKSGAGQP